MNHKCKIILTLLSISFLYGGTRVAYSRPGLMMKIPTSSNKKAPYLFRTGFGAEIHNFNPFNTAKGVYFDMELSRGFGFGFSAAMGGDTTKISMLEESQYSAPVEFGFHLQQKVYSYNDISLSVGLQDIVFESEQTSGDMLSLNTSLLSFFVVLASEKDLGEYKMNTYMGFGTGGLAPLKADTINITNTIEAILLGAGRPVRISEMRAILEADGIRIELSDIKKSLNILEERYKDTSLEINDVASGYRLQIKNQHSSSLSHLWNEKAPRTSKALMETISIIAFKQPVTRGDIEDIRGVTVSTKTIRALLERNWIKLSGYREVPGRPALYVTTKDFLDDLNLKSISELPELPEAIKSKDIDLLSQAV